MSDDWKAGDVAVCVDARPRHYSHPDGSRFLVLGRHYRVTGSRLGDATGEYSLHLAGAPNPLIHFTATRFRKLNDEPDNIALIERIKRPQPAKETANV